jgi:hypothetical protein
MEDFRSVFRRLPFENSWLYSVAKLTRVECRCVSTRGCPTNTTNIEGTGVIQQPEGGDLVIGQLTLPASRHDESKADWSGPEVIVPQIPDLLLPEVKYVKQHQALLEDVWAAWEGPGEGEPAPRTVPITMSQLQQQMEAKLLARKWSSIGAVAGSIAVIAVISMCLWRHWRMVAAFRARCLRGSTIAGVTPENHTSPTRRASRGKAPTARCRL